LRADGAPAACRNHPAKLALEYSERPQLRICSI
jgi:hypothetical protein